MGTHLHVHVFRTSETQLRAEINKLSMITFVDFSMACSHCGARRGNIPICGELVLDSAILQTPVS